LVGKNAEHAREILSRLHLPFEIVEADANTIMFKANDAMYTVEELLGMMFAHIRELGEADAQSAIKDAVITVPAFYTQRERQAIIDAAELAGLNVLSLINDHTAVALQYGIQHSAFAVDKQHTVMFFDMGSGCLTVSIAEFTAVKQQSKKGKKDDAQEIGQLQVLSVAVDETLGGGAFDRLIANMLAERWNQKHGGDVRTNERAMVRLLRGSIKAKEILSANTETDVSIEGLMNDEDFFSHITRAEFEEASAPLLERIRGTVQRALEQSNRSLEAIDGVLLVGGASRIPMVKQVLQQV